MEDIDTTYKQDAAQLAVTTTVPMEAWLKTAAELRRVTDELTKLKAGNSIVARLDLAEKTVLRQQLQLTQMNKAVLRKRRQNDALRKELDGYRSWASKLPLTTSRTLLNQLKERSEAILKDQARQRAST